jgi:hypothetical protein
MLADAWTHADGYRLIRWHGVPADRYIDDVAYLDSRFLTDAPTGDLEWEPEKIDADRIRKHEQRWIEMDVGRFHTGMVHSDSDRLVAWTTLSGAADTPTHLWQHITLVDPLHRGHRLGTIVKVANLAYAREHPTSAGRDRHLERDVQRVHARDQPGDGLPGGRYLGGVAEDRVSRASHGRSGVASYPPAARPACRSNALRAPYEPVSTYE